MIGNYHTHTRFCDGKNTPEEMVLEALRLGCPAIGFSGHSFTPFDPGYCMNPISEPEYRAEIHRLQQVYRDRIAIYLGIEQDYFSPPSDPEYAYRIGSVHYVEKNGTYLSIDDTPELLREGVEALYGGDFYALAEDYFRLAAQIPQKTGCDIVGHFDLICKFNRDGSFFDETHPRYRTAALRALDSLLDQGALLEINTGAISRGYRDTPYPADFLLERMGKRGAQAVFSSDAHRAQDLLSGLPLVQELAERWGIRLVNERTPNPR